MSAMSAMSAKNVRIIVRLFAVAILVGSVFGLLVSRWL